jgi:hypothetical protein
VRVAAPSRCHAGHDMNWRGKPWRSIERSCN